MRPRCALLLMAVAITGFADAGGQAQMDIGSLAAAEARWNQAGLRNYEFTFRYSATPR